MGLTKKTSIPKAGQIVRPSKPARARIDRMVSLLELCRLRMAQLFQCAFSSALRYAPAKAAGLDESKIAALSTYYASPLYNPAERICIEFAKMFALGAGTIGDEDVNKLAAAIGAEPMIYLMKALSVMDQLQRSMSAFRFEPPSVAPKSRAFPSPARVRCSLIP